MVRPYNVVGDTDIVIPFQWSTSEQVWPFELDQSGNTLYCKCFLDQALANGTPVDIAHGVASMDDEKIFKIWGKVKLIAGGTNVYMLPFRTSSTNSIQLRTPDATNIRIDLGGNWTAWEANIYFIYSKT